MNKQRLNARKRSKGCDALLGGVVGGRGTGRQKRGVAYADLNTISKAHRVHRHYDDGARGYPSPTTIRSGNVTRTGSKNDDINAKHRNKDMTAMNEILSIAESCTNDDLNRARAFDPKRLKTNDRLRGVKRQTRKDKVAIQNSDARNLSSEYRSNCLEQRKRFMSSDVSVYLNGRSSSSLPSPTVNFSLSGGSRSSFAGNQSKPAPSAEIAEVDEDDVRKKNLFTTTCKDIKRLVYPSLGKEMQYMHRLQSLKSIGLRDVKGEKMALPEMIARKKAKAKRVEKINILEKSLGVALLTRQMKGIHKGKTAKKRVDRGRKLRDQNLKMFAVRSPQGVSRP